VPFTRIQNKKKTKITANVAVFAPQKTIDAAQNIFMEFLSSEHMAHAVSLKNEQKFGHEQEMQGGDYSRLASALQALDVEQGAAE